MNLSLVLHDSFVWELFLLGICNKKSIQLMVSFLFKGNFVLLFLSFLLFLRIT